MKLTELIHSLTDPEREFIAGLDYGQGQTRHRAMLDAVIQNDGIINFESQGYWYPWEVVELGKNWLQPGHEREYAACVGVVLANMISGGDHVNEVDDLVDAQYESIALLPMELRSMLDEMIEQLMESANTNLEPISGS